MRIEQVALPAMRQISRRPHLAPLLDRVLRPWNPFSPALNVDPYPAYEMLRAKGPIVWHPGLNQWLVTSFSLCEAVLRSPVSVDRGGLFDVVPPWSKLNPADRSSFTESMLLQDPPNHTRLRRLVSRAFTPRTMERIEPRITEIANELVDKVRHEQTVDLFDAVFAPLPIYVIGELLGIPEDDWPRLKAWSDEFAKMVDIINAFAPKEMHAALTDMKQALDGWIDLRTADPGDDLLSQLIAAEDEDGRLSRPELQAMITLLMTAGHETTSGLLGNALVALADQPVLRERLAVEADIVGPAVEELIRFDSPVQNTYRVITEPLEIGDVRIKPGQMALLAFGGANRDPEQFERPNTVDFDRADIRSLSFGHGIHHCLGAALARLEARIVLPLVCETFPDHRIEQTGLRWKRSLTLRGPIVLPVRR